MRVTYDKSADAAYIYLTEKSSEPKYTYLCDPLKVAFGFHLDFDLRRRLVGIEVLAASKLLPREIVDRASSPGQSSWPFLSASAKNREEFLLQVLHDKSVDKAYVCSKNVKKIEVARTYRCDPRRVGFGVYLDFDAGHHLVGVEVEAATKHLPVTALDKAVDCDWATLDLPDRRLAEKGWETQDAVDDSCRDARTLVDILLDRSLSPEDREDAATDLSDFDDSFVLAALVAIGTDQEESRSLLAQCGYSIGSIWLRTGECDPHIFAGLTLSAQNVLRSMLGQLRPIWLSDLDRK